ncbi:hypothetical protein IHE45_11G081300 [Dioscorea alata]|uniref:Uncharacterized protein n=1 Tax=Dioscorea alata TaxID=55571 RepID=A0ACB7V7M0_DIOAL|nr:hypothetical protein IHE45_11G081300 [Dioscorea alata]
MDVRATILLSRSFSSRRTMKPSSLQTLKAPIRSKPKENSHFQSKRSDSNPIDATKPPKIVAKSLASTFSTISDEMTADPSKPTAPVPDPDILAVDPLEASIIAAADNKKEPIAMDTPALKPEEEIGSSEVVKEVAIVEEVGGNQGWSSDPATLMNLSVWIVFILTLAVTAAGWLLWWSAEWEEEGCSVLHPT